MRDLIFFLVVSAALLGVTLALLDNAAEETRENPCFYGCPTVEPLK